MTRLFHRRNRIVLFNDCPLDSINDILHVIICHIRPCGEAHANLEQCFAHAVDVSRSILVHRLLVHRLPQRASLNLSLVHDDTQSLHISVGLTIRVGTFSGMYDASGTAHGACHDGLVGVLLAFYANLGIYGHSAEPEVRVVAAVRITMHLDVRHILQHLLIQCLYVLVVCDMVVLHCHLTTADAGTYIAHTVVETCLLVLVVSDTISDTA